LARAKRTDRTEARRRYRAVVSAAEQGEPNDPNTLSGHVRAVSTPAVAVAARPSITAAFRGAVRPLDIRGDIRALPVLVRERGFLISIAVAVLSTAVYMIAAGSSLASVTDQSSVAAQGAFLALSLFVFPPPAAGGFLIGFFAKRGSWLTGLIFGIVAAVCYSILILTFASTSTPKAGDPTADQVVLGAFVASPVGAALFAAAAAWYRRFLDLVNPNRGQRRPARQAQARVGQKRR
jgi:hypothetical protein